MLEGLRDAKRIYKKTESGRAGILLLGRNGSGFIQFSPNKSSVDSRDGWPP